MLDLNSRPYDQMADYYPPTEQARARLADFQDIFKKGNAPYIYSNYYNNNYDVYMESEADAAANVYHTLVSSNDYHYDNWKCKVVDTWNEDDTVAWIIDCAEANHFHDFDIPYHNFRITGLELRSLKREDLVQRMYHISVDPYLSRRIADIIFDRLQARIHDEDMRHQSVLRYGDSSYQNTETPTVLDLDHCTYRHRLDNIKSDTHYAHPADLSDDAEEFLRPLATPSPEYYGSDGSKSGDDEDKRKLFKRPPGRPKGSGRKVSKRPRSVSVPEFLRNLLFDEKYCPSIIKWEDHSQGKFRFVKPDEVAKLWGQMKQNDNMTFEKFSRAMRYHYRQSVLVSVPTARLVYQFGHKGPDFKSDNPNFVKVKTELDAHDMPYS